MTRITGLTAAFALMAGAASGQVDRGEDFTGAWGSASALDRGNAGSNGPRTPTLDADNQSFGTWDGHYTGTVGAGIFMNNSTGFGADNGSEFRSFPGVGAGFLAIGVNDTGNEAGTYGYSAPFATVDLSGDARIQFDCTLTGLTTPPGGVDLRVMLRVPNNPPTPPEAWIISEPINLAGVGVTPSLITNPANWATPNIASPDVAAVSVRPDTLDWLSFSVADTDLVPIDASTEFAGSPGAMLPGFVVPLVLPQVTGFGIYLESNPSAPAGNNSIWIDAIHLRDAISVPVELSRFEWD